MYRKSAAVLLAVARGTACTQVQKQPTAEMARVMWTDTPTHRRAGRHTGTQARTAHAGIISLVFCETHLAHFKTFNCQVLGFGSEDKTRRPRLRSPRYNLHMQTRGSIPRLHSPRYNLHMQTRGSIPRLHNPRYNLGVRVARSGSHPPRMQHRVDGSYQSRMHTE